MPRVGESGSVFARQLAVPIIYKVEPVSDGFKADIVVAHELILKIKAATIILPIHEVRAVPGQGGSA
jgi:GxxExxY protein